MPFVSLSLDPAFDLAALIEKITEEKAASADVKSPLAQLIEQKKYREFLEAGVFNRMQGLMEKATNSELNDCFSLCFSLLHEIEAQYHTDMIQRLATGLCSTPTFARTKLQLLCMLFNLLENLSPIRATVFIQMLRLAIASNTSKRLIKEFPRVLNWVSQWNLSVESQAEVYLLMSQAYAQVNAATNSQVFLLKYLRTFDGADEKRLAQATENASKAIIATLADNAVNQCDPL
jgi:translation initiation factor 3 subunit M